MPPEDENLLTNPNPTDEAPSLEEPQVEDTAPSSEEPSAVATQPEHAAVEPPKETPRKIPTVPKWMEDRLNKEVGRNHEKQRLLDQAMAENEALRAALEASRRQPSAGGTSPPPPPVSQQDEPPNQPRYPNPQATDPDYVLRADVERLATEKARADAFNAEADRTYYDGKSKFQDWDDAIRPLQVMGATNSVEFLDAAMASGEASAVLYHLGQHPDEASRLLRLSPTRMAAEMAKIALGAVKPAATRPTSRAPDPIRPIGGNVVTPNYDPEKGTMSDFASWWDKRQEEKRRQRR